jgi:deoxyribodipyrimidine photo-lyase
MRRLPSLPAAGDLDALADWVGGHLADLCSDSVAPSPAVRGGQRAAHSALAAFDVSGYAARRNEVWPALRRGASGLSPFIRHGLLTLAEVWNHVAGGPARDVTKFRDELLWQEYSRHVYARLGTATRQPLRHQPQGSALPPAGTAIDPAMACLSAVTAELETDGWLVNQTRMWFASHWSVRHNWDWQSGEDYFFTHLLDGSRAANRLGWQWTVGAGTGKPYGFSQWQVRKRAPGLCESCALVRSCPIVDWPDSGALHPVAEPDPRLRHDTDPQSTAGPVVAEITGDPQLVWITAESLGHADPALVAHPDLPAVFVFDEALLERLRLSSKRLVFLAECLAELAAERELVVWRGSPPAVLAGRAVASTFAPVPGWRRYRQVVAPVAVHPWPWLSRPDAGSITSFSAWRRRHGHPAHSG